MSAFEQVSRAGLFAQEVLGDTPAARQLSELRRRPLLLSLAPRLAETRRGQVMLATAANILGRLFDFVGNIDVDVDPSARVLTGIFGLRARSRLGPAVANFLRSLRPESHAAAAPGPALQLPYARALVIGDVRGLPADEILHIDARGWLACVGPSLPGALRAGGGSFNPFGPMVAAAWGATEIARSLFRQLAGGTRAQGFEPLEKVVFWNLWTHEFDGPHHGPPLPQELDLGELAVAGLGALGSAAIVALAQLPAARGRVELVDDDRLSVTNLERVFTAHACDVGRPKAYLARRALRPTRAQPVEIRGRYGDALPRRARAATILVGVDSGTARRQIGRLLPEAIYNGGTQEGEILVTRHVRFGGPCLECFYPNVEDPIARTAQRLGVDRATAAALVAGERRIDTGVLEAMRQRGGIELNGMAEKDLLDRPLAAVECSRAVVIEELPEATIGFVAAMCGFLMVSELVKDRLDPDRREPLDDARPAFRLDLLQSTPGADCVESYVPRQDCFCQSMHTRRRIAALRGE